MNDTKQKADALVEKHYDAYWEMSKFEAILHAILSTKNIIKVLESIKHQIDEDNFSFIIDEQTEILKELEGRL